MNTLYVMAKGATLRRDGLTIQVLVDRKVQMSVPIHHLQSVAVFGGVRMTAPVLGLCAERGVAVSFLTCSGRLLARVDAPNQGNVLLRRAQYRMADQPECTRRLAQAFIAGKLQNARNLCVRGARETDECDDAAKLRRIAGQLAGSVESLASAASLDVVRGIEGEAARNYFGGLTHLFRQPQPAFQMNGRTRRPPRDRMNALLSFIYSLLTHDCVAAAASAGLDPSVGYLHCDRSGRPGLALDLMEEFRPYLADRLAVTLVNRQQVKAEGFIEREGGSIEMTDATRRTVVREYQARKRDSIHHPVIDRKVLVGLLPSLQARILARVLRGDLPDYLPCIPKG
jgi:CRISPR-associated protein Cas1